MKAQGIKIEIPEGEMRQTIRDLEKFNTDAIKEIQRVVVRSTYRVGARARKKAPVNFGKLRSSIREKVSKMTGEISVNVDYAGAVEFGTKAHIIRPRKKKALAFTPGGGFRFWDESGRIIRKSVKHPGTQAQPYLRPAVQEEEKTFQLAVKKAIENATKGK